MRHYQYPAFSAEEKKSLHWHSSFGSVYVMEPLLRNRQGQIRPFCRSSGVSPRGYSQPLQRILVDFGADHAFARAQQKVKEHYGVELPTSSLRKITLHHGEQMWEQQQRIPDGAQAAGCDQLIVETDGSFIPIMTADEASPDRRKHKALHWQEAKLALAHLKGSTTPKFGVSFQHGPTGGGHQLLRCAVLAGLGRQTKVHGVGDGAVWIARQMEEQFGAQGTYLVDLYHTCEYLAAAAPTCSPDQPVIWRKQQKQRMKQSDTVTVLKALKACCEPAAIPDAESPVRVAYRYLSNRTNQLDYQRALEQGLPIGSGEIESAHRYIIKERLKLPGAWWNATNAESMLALRVERANQEWASYWQDFTVSKAA